jgi:hypothetical protein
MNLKRVASMRSFSERIFLGVGVFAFAGWMLDCQDHDLFGGIVDDVVDEVLVATSHQLPDATYLLASPDARKENQGL